MNRTRACKILRLVEYDFDVTDITRQYRRLALLNHPGKKPASNVEATKTFQEIHAAYEFLQNNGHSPFEGGSRTATNYQDLLFEYITSLMRPGHKTFQDVASQLFYSIAERLTTQCEEKAMNMLERMDRHTFLKVYALLKKCNDVLFIPAEWKTRMEELHAAKTENDHVILLQPRLEDLMEDNVFRVTLNGHTFYIPLWHHEIVYDRPDCDGGELTVQCVPTLPDNMALDENNHLHVHIQKDRGSIWDSVEVEVPICCNKTLKIDRHSLYIREYQRVVLKGEGISRIDDHDIYDVSKKSDIIVHIKLT